MKLAGHTHGVGEICRDVFEMVDRIAALGFDGIEIAARPAILTVDTPEPERSRLRAHIAQSGLELANIACYAGQGESGLNAEDAAVRDRAGQDIEDHIRLAADVGSPRVRVFPGGPPGLEGVTVDPQRAFEVSVSGIQRLAAIAADLGVSLVIENHPNSIACSAEETVALVEAVARPNVRILYEPSNLLVYAGRDDHEHGFNVQKSWVSHVHIKDQARKPEGGYAATVTGRGILPWPDIVSWLKSAGYDQCLSFELAWTDDVGKREEELKEGLAYMRSLMAAT